MNKKLKLFSMFSGFGGAEFALKKANIDFECVGFSEIDKYAIQCYEQNHEGKNYGDCTKIKEKELPDFDLLTGGFPCQSFSIAGKGLGELDTRGTLFHDIIRIAEHKKPKHILLENVKGLTFKPHKKTFNKILSELDRIGYNVNWKVLNSKEHGIPQNRERVFFVCIRKDLVQEFEFPQKEELKIFLKDILEDNPNSKFNLSQKNLDHYNRDFGSKGKILKGEENSPTLTTAMGSGGGNVPAIDEKYYLTEKQKERLFSKERSLKVVQIIPKDKIISECENYTQYDKSGKGYNSQQDRIRRLNKPSNSLAVGTSSIPKIKINETEKDLVIRKITPKECFRLMGFLDDGINLEGLSNTQRYKLAGNGWDLSLVSKIFRKLYEM